MEVQARIPSALCALHNFICHHDSGEIFLLDDEVGPELEEGHGEHEENEEGHWEHMMDEEYGEDYGEDYGKLSTSGGVVPSPEKERSERKRDDIANEMWNQYSNS